MNYSEFIDTVTDELAGRSVDASTSNIESLVDQLISYGIIGDYDPECVVIDDEFDDGDVDEAVDSLEYDITEGYTCYSG